MDSDFIDLIKNIAVATIAFTLIFAIVFVPVAGAYAILEYGQCAKLEAYGTEHDYRWSIFTGCLVQTQQGYWVDSNNPTLLELEGD
jgi:hypothetical protein